MKQHFISVFHNPKKVIIFSLIWAIIIGFFGYTKINQKPTDPYNQIDAKILLNESNDSYQNKNLTLGFLSGGRIKSVSVTSGDVVKKGDVLATLDAGNVVGALTQAKALYATAQANYQKVINGVTSADSAVNKTSVEISQTALLHSKETLVLSLNNSLTSATNAVNNNTNSIFINPHTSNPELATVDMIFTNQQLENTVIDERIRLNQMFSLWKQELDGVSANGDMVVLTDHSLSHLQDIAVYLDDLNSLFTQYSSGYKDNAKTVVLGNILSARAGITGQITSLTNGMQSVSNAQKNVEQSQAILAQKISQARPEDVAIAEAQVSNAYGAVQIAEASFQNTIITAPSDGMVMSVSITPGQMAVSNAPAIEFLSGSVKN